MFETDNESRLPAIRQSALVQIEQSRAVQEVQAALIIAKRFPRDLNASYSRIIESCKRLTLAGQAMYSYPRGGAMVTGPSIRLAEVLAQNYGNLDFGIREIERRENVSIAESYCYDLETNVKNTKIFEVPHLIDLKDGKSKKISDNRSIYEAVANQGSRRLRACILSIVPGDIVDAAVNQCKATLAKGSGEPIADRIRKVVVAFKELGVSQEMLEDRLGHKIDLTTAEEIVDLTAIYTSLRDKQSVRSDFFTFKDEEKEAKNTDLRSKLDQRLKDSQTPESSTVEANQQQVTQEKLIDAEQPKESPPPKPEPKRKRMEDFLEGKNIGENTNG